MAKKILGFDIGGYELKIAQLKGDVLTGYTVEHTPDNLIKEGKFTSFNAMAEFIRDTMKKNRINGKEAAIAVPSEACFLRRVKLPKMTIPQLRVNLPFEFRDFVEGDLNEYIYDYAVLKMEENTMELMAAAIQKRTVNDYREMMRRVGLKLTKLVPDVLGFQSILKHSGMVTEDKRDFAILDLGHTSTRIYFFSDGAYEITRTLNTGSPAMVQAVAEAKGVDIHIARLYLEANQENVLDLPSVTELFEDISIEVMRIMNFYSYSNPNNTIDRLYYCGGGLNAERVIRGVHESTELEVIPFGGLVKEYTGFPALNLGPHAYGIVIE